MGQEKALPWKNWEVVKLIGKERMEMSMKSGKRIPNMLPERH